jgi:ribosomal protein S18 acetylase RimI-like enzyme
MNVRPATPDDAAAVSDVAEAAWWETYPGVLDPDAVEAALAELYDEAFLREVLEEREDLLFLVCEVRPEGEPRSGRTATDGSRESAEDDGEIVGFATAQQTWADEVAVHTVYVHPDRWSEGVGTALLEEIEASARAADADRLRAGVLSGNHVGRSFLESRGFERVETETAEVGGETVPEDVFERKL